jgi:hypothetical protein
MSAMVVEHKHPTLPITLTFEDDGRTGYAYLVRAPEGIVADVWVYNAGDAPEENDWEDVSLAPFRNSKSYVSHTGLFQLPDQVSDVKVNWFTADDGRVGGSLLIRGKVVAKLLEGDKPGMSLMASRDGPVARVLR